MIVKGACPVMTLLTSMQNTAVQDIEAWYKKANDQYFVLAGFAGTGKTFLIQHAMERLNIPRFHVAFATFTGKAALVLTQKADGKFECYTLHHLMYEPVTIPGGGVAFTLKDKRQFKHFKLLVIDECSMVPQEILDDLMKLGVQILFVGDHGQLEPIGETTWLYDRLQDADATLTEILRQAEGNPIIHLSMLARTGKRIEKRDYDKKALVISKRDINKRAGLKRSLLSADQVICGYNKTRERLNAEIRDMLGFSGKYPQEGEKIICLRNNWKKEIPSCSLVNGLIGYAQNVQHQRATRDVRQHISFNLQPDFTDKEKFMNLKLLPEQFLGQEVRLGRDEYHEYDRFDFGHVITTHKSQGSQWGNVFVFNEPFGEDPRRHTYTAITRAANKLILAM